MAAWTPNSVLEKLFKVDPRVARVILIGLSVLAAVAMVGAWQIDESRILPTFLWLVGGYLVFAFLANMPGWLGSLLGALACLSFFAYLGLFAVQLVAQNILTPPLMAAGCFFDPNVQGCPLNMIPPTERRVLAGGSVEAPAESSEPSTGVEESMLPSPSTDEFDVKGYEVFVQFSPSRLGETSVAELIDEMVANGWIIAPEAEALPSAFGLNEVRYFHEEDREAAERLAAAVARNAPWTEEVRVRDFTQLSDSARPGLLEVWTSG